jgi:hypothetical protein
MRNWLLSLVAILLLSSVAHGQSASIYVAASQCLNDSGDPYLLVLPGSQLLAIEIRAYAPQGATSYEFSIPGFTLDAGILVVDWIPNPEAAFAEGNPFVEGARISFPNCPTTPVTLYTATLFVLGADAIVPWTVAPHSFPSEPGRNCPTATPCGGGSSYCVVPGVPERFPVPPTNPSPADGATGVPLHTTLGFYWATGSCWCLGLPCMTLYFGEDPDPPVLVSGCDIPLPELDLEPSTTYYWRAYVDYCGSATGPVWSFTTEPPIGVERATWSHVKQIYRDPTR